MRFLIALNCRDNAVADFVKATVDFLIVERNLKIVKDRRLPKRNNLKAIISEEVT